MTKMNIDIFLKNKTIIIVLSVLGILLIGLVVGLVFALSPKSRPVINGGSSDISESISTASSDMEDTTDSSNADSSQEGASSVNDNTSSSTAVNGSTTTTKSTNKTVSATTTTKPSASSYMDYTKYNLDTYMTPLWAGNVVYNESIMFIPNAKTKQMEPAPLLYTPDKILSVRSSDLKTEYKEGVDYTVENGCIKLTANSSIWSWDYDSYYLASPAAVPIGSVSASGRYVLYSNGAIFADTQLAVTYTHSDKWTGTVSQYAGTKLTNTITKLKNKQNVTVVYYGDSILAGGEASGNNGYEPFMPPINKLVTAQLKKSYDTSNITEINTSVGGMHSEWGKEQAAERVAKYNPDLVIIGFGMNDSGLTVEVNGAKSAVDVARYEANIRAIITSVRSKNPNAEFILVSTTVPNPDCSGWTVWQPKYKTGLENIAKDTTGVTIAPMTDVQAYILTKKRYADMNGNGVNHPNDFMCRVYAQTISQCIVQNIG